jgi:hypothetical protein
MADVVFAIINEFVCFGAIGTENEYNLFLDLGSFMIKIYWIKHSIPDPFVLIAIAWLGSPFPTLLYAMT